MITDRRIYKDIDDYITDFPEDTQEILQQIRKTIKRAAPGAEEKISYSMPAFTYQGQILVYFAAFKSHIGFYAIPSGHEAFAGELAAYKGGKGSVQFPLNKPMPYPLITEIVKFRAKENLEKAELKAKKKSK